MQNIKKRLFEDFCAKEQDGYFEIEFPIVINTSGTLIFLRIDQHEDHYVITHPDNIFDDCGNGSLDFYFDIYKKHSEGQLYGVDISDGVLTKVCHDEYNVAVAISDFLKFMITFDDFFTKNGIIGREEEFA